MKRMGIVTIALIVALTYCSDDQSLQAPIERRPFVLLQDSITVNSELMEGSAPTVHIDGTLLPYMHDDTSITITDPEFEFQDCIRLAKAERMWFSGLENGVVGGSTAICQFPYRYCPWSPRFTTRGITDSISVNSVDDSGLVSISFRERTALLGKGDTFQIVQTLLDTQCLSRVGDSFRACSEQPGDTFAYSVIFVTKTITLTNKGLYGWDQIQYYENLNQ